MAGGRSLWCCVFSLPRKVVLSGVKRKGRGKNQCGQSFSAHLPGVCGMKGKLSGKGRDGDASCACGDENGS